MQKLVSYRYEMIWGLFLISLPFSKALINIVLVLGILFLVYDIVIKKTAFVKPSTTFIVLFVFIICLSINAFLQGNVQENKLFYKLYPLLIGTYFTIINIKNDSVTTIKKISGVVGVFYVLVCFVRIGLYYTEFQVNPFGNSNVINHILILERPYGACLSLINIILLYDLFLKEIKKKNKHIYLILIFFLTVFIVLIAARLALLSLLIITVVYILFFSKIKFKMKLSLLLGIPLLLAVLLISSKGLQERLFIGKSFEIFKDYEPRFVIWEGVFEIVASKDFNLISGTGNYQEIENKLVNHYQKIEGNLSKRDYYLSERFNSHNQFLDILLFGGIFAFLTLVFILGCFFICFKKNFTSFAILGSLVLFMLVENIFHRQTGCYLFMIYLILAFKINSEDKVLSQRILIN